MRVALAAFALAAFALAALVGAQDAEKTQGKTRASTPRASTEYHLYVAAESSDEVYRLVFDGAKLRVDEVIRVGYQPTEIEGPHGLAVGLDGKHWFVSIAHGKPFGLLYKYETATDKLVGETELGMFPATMQVSKSTGLLYCVNFNLHGRMIPSTVSIVDPDAMVEVARTTTGPMPHGSRLSADGLHHYSCAMMSGHLFEIDAASFKVTRNLQLDAKPPKGHDSTIKPTWVHAHPTNNMVYVALNGAAQIAEVDLAKWKVVRRWKTDKGPYNLEVSPDGKKLVVSYKTAGKVGIWDIAKGEEVARIKSSRKVTHGVVISPDSRYAFVSAEGKGAEAGTVDVFDLNSNQLVSTATIGLQAGGIAFWKIVESGT